MAILDLKSKFKNTLAAAAGASLALSPIAGATAQDAQPQQRAEFTQVAATTNVALTQDAPHAAYQWSKLNRGIAVAVKLGTESSVTPQQIEQILTREIQNVGVSDVVFFYEQNDVAGTGVAYSFAGNTDGPFSLGEAREAAVKSAKQYLFQQSNPAMAVVFNP